MEIVIDSKRLAEITKHWNNGDYNQISDFDKDFQDMINTLSATLRVVEAVKKVKYASVGDFEKTHEELEKVLAPFEKGGEK